MRGPEMSTPKATSSRDSIVSVLRSVATTVALVIVALAAVAIFATGSPLSDTAPQIDARAMDGRPVRLAELAGRPVVLYFWATWCSACKLTSPTVDGYAGRNPDVPVIAVAADNLATVKAYLAGEQRSFTVVADGEPIIRRLGVRAFPTTAILDAAGKVVWTRQGVLLPGEIDLRMP